MRRPRRIGSYLEYVAYVTRKTTLDWGFVLLTIGAAACGAVTMIGGVATLLLGFSPPLLMFTLLMGGFTYGLLYCADAAGNTSQVMEPVAPPTRQNIETLSARETLLRASQEPTEGQERVLLRAAAATEEVKPEELLRATTQH